MIKIFLLLAANPLYSSNKVDSLKIDSTFYANGALKATQYFLNNERVYKYEEYYMSGKLKKIGYFPKDTFGTKLNNQIFNNYELCLNKKNTTSKCDLNDTSIYSFSNFNSMRSNNPFFYEFYENGFRKNTFIIGKDSNLLSEIVFDENCDTISIESYGQTIIEGRPWWQLEGVSKYYDKPEEIVRLREYKNGTLKKETIFRNRLKIIKFKY